jgi:chemotaxis protein CheD
MRPTATLHKAPVHPAPLSLESTHSSHRRVDPSTGRWTTRVLPGECYVTGGNEILTTVLGSCISACIRDPQVGVGGMNHFLLPVEPGVAPVADSALGLATRYGGHAMETLINELMKRGASRQRLEIKLFGGGRMFASHTDVGLRNIEFIRHFLEIEGLHSVAEDLGDVYPRTVTYEPATGRARVKRLKPIEAQSISRQEQDYMRSVDRKDDGGDIELFN